LLANESELAIPGIGEVVPLQDSAPFWRNQGQGWHLVQPFPVLRYRHSSLPSAKPYFGMRWFSAEKFKSGIISIFAALSVVLSQHYL
jgi:hypothetical protein